MKPMYKHAMKVLVVQLLIILIPLLALAIPGRLLDKYLGTSPFYLIIGVVIALGITVSLSFLVVKKMTARLENIARKGEKTKKELSNQEDDDDDEDKSKLI